MLLFHISFFLFKACPGQCNEMSCILLVSKSLNKQAFDSDFRHQHIPTLYPHRITKTHNKRGKAHKCNIEVRSCNHCYCRKAINKYYIFEYVFVDLRNQPAMRLRRIVIRGLPGSTNILRHINFSLLSKKQKRYCALTFKNHASYM
jgi:hypothetical protein